MNTHPPHPLRRRRAGFSLVEVALALIVAAGGLLAVFGVFPVSLRQSQMSRSDMNETGFASALLQTLGGNIRDIDDIAVWNDPKEFWKAAARGSGLPETLYDDKKVHASGKKGTASSAAVAAEHDKAAPRNGGKPQWTDHPFSPMTTFVASTYGNESGDAENIWYIAAERTEGVVPGDSELVQPAQFLIRLACIRRTAHRATGNRNTRRVLPTSAVVAEAVGQWEDADETERTAVLPNIYLLSVVSTDRGFPDVFIREPVFSQEFTFVHRP